MCTLFTNKRLHLILFFVTALCFCIVYNIYEGLVENWYNPNRLPSLNKDKYYYYYCYNC